MTASEQPIKIAIQGIHGAFHEVAALNYFGNNITVVPCLTFKELCDVLATGKADKAVMAIENTIAGSILSNYALIQQFGFKITGEVYLNIQMSLMANKGVKLSEITEVESHPIALLQCKDFLYTHLKAIHRESDDTAVSARDLFESKCINKAVIASERCAAMYNLCILAHNIETNRKNFTRFLVLDNENSELEAANKASVCLQLKHEVGALADVLVALKEERINLTKIQSLPIIGSPYEYNFYLDVEWAKGIYFDRAMERLIHLAGSFSLLGKYKKGSFNLEPDRQNQLENALIE